MPVKTSSLRRDPRRVRHAATALFLLLSLPFSAGAKTVLPPGLLPLQPRPSPALRLSNMDGKVTDLRDLRGHWVMVHFWASWCGPCRREMPAIQSMAGKLVPRALRLVLVNTAERDDDVFAFLGAVAPNLDSLMDRDGSVTARWRPRGLPSTYLVDPQGRERYLALGGRHWDSNAYLEFLSRLPG